MKIKLFPSPQYIISQILGETPVPNARKIIHIYLFSRMRFFKVNTKTQKAQELIGRQRTGRGRRAAERGQAWGGWGARGLEGQGWDASVTLHFVTHVENNIIVPHWMNTENVRAWRLMSRASGCAEIMQEGSYFSASLWLSGSPLGAILSPQSTFSNDWRHFGASQLEGLGRGTIGS